MKGEGGREGDRERERGREAENTLITDVMERGVSTTKPSRRKRIIRILRTT